MKKLSLLLFLAFPLLLQAQGDDYCPCQETQNSFEQLMGAVSSVNDDFVIVVPPSTSYYTPVQVAEETIDLPVLDTSNEKVRAEEEIEEEPEEAAPAPEVRRTRDQIQGKKKKRKRWRKKRKKKRKYKGGCPWF